MPERPDTLQRETLEGTRMTVAHWLAAAEADADRRGMPELKPLLRGLAASTTALRAADWNDRADADGATPAPVGPGDSGR